MRRNVRPSPSKDVGSLTLLFSTRCGMRAIPALTGRAASCAVVFGVSFEGLVFVCWGSINSMLRASIALFAAWLTLSDYLIGRNSFRNPIQGERCWTSTLANHHTSDVLTRRSAVGRFVDGYQFLDIHADAARSGATGGGPIASRGEERAGIPNCIMLAKLWSSMCNWVLACHLSISSRSESWPRVVLGPCSCE